MGEHHVAAYLVTLAVGYWVLTLAGKEEKPTRTIGQLIAWGIIIVSICGALCAGFSKMMGCHTIGSCDTSYSSSCPFTSGSKMSGCPDMQGMTGKEAVPTVPAVSKKKADSK